MHHLALEDYVARRFSPALVVAADEQWLYQHLRTVVAGPVPPPHQCWQLVVWAADRGSGEDARWAADRWLSVYREPYMTRLPNSKLVQIEAVAQHDGTFEASPTPIEDRRRSLWERRVT